jgi:LysM repeat protein
MNLVDKPAKNWVNGVSGTAKGNHVIIYKSTPVNRAAIEKERIEATRMMNYEYLKKPITETTNIGTENTTRGGAETLPQPFDENYHVVNKGETLYSISKKYQLSTLEIKALNNLKDNMIEIGQQLRIRE